MANNERKFRNPYNFIPLARLSEKALEGPLGHAAPAGHDRFHDDLWSGRLKIRIRTVTPLLIPDASRAYVRPGDENKASEQRHWILPLRMDGDKPRLAVTSFKGALRSAYEAVTNSRFGVFGKHDQPVEERIGPPKKNGKAYLATKIKTATPSSMLPPESRPTTKIAELSPADRVFGWVNQQGKGAYRGQLRIHSLGATEAASGFIEKFDHPLPLANLSTPKLKQTRFYVGDATGQAQPDGLSGQDAKYDREKMLRGRKVYPHHQAVAQTTDYWDKDASTAEASARPESDPVEIRGYYREFIRRSGIKPRKKGVQRIQPRDGQNRSIEAWVAPGAEFTGEIDVTNLSDAELGALIWLLHLPHLAGEDGTPHHRLGLGKPLGFGSVQIEITGADLRTGQAMRADYAALFDAPDLSEPGARVIEAEGAEAVSAAVAELVAAYQSAVVEGYTPDGKGSFESVPFIAAFLRAARGYADGLPQHYPRTSEAPDPAGENFKWFMANQGKKGKKLALTDLVKDDGFPYDP